MWPFAKKREARGTGFISFGDLLTSATTAAGITVTRQNSIEHPAVYRCLDLNQSTISSFPVDCLVKRGEVRLPYPEPLWLKQPNDYQDFHGLLGETQTSCDQYDSAFLLKAVDGAGRLVGLSVLDPTSITVKRVDFGNGPKIVYEVQLATGRVALSQTEILHIPAGLPIPGALRGIAPVEAIRETIGLGLAARQYGANFYGTGATMSGVIEDPKTYNEETAKRLQESMQKKHGGVSKSHAVGVLFGGAKWVQITTDPEKAQALEAQKYVDGIIASAHGIPAEYVSPAIEGAKGYVTGLYQRQMLWYQTGLYPRITRLERAFSRLLPGGAYIRLNVNGWLRMDPEQRVAYYNAGQLGEWLSVEEIRALEDMNPTPTGTVLHSVQWQDNTPQPDAEVPQ